MKMTVTTMAHVSSCGPRHRRLVLRQEILRGARDAVVVGPAIHYRKGLAPVAMPGWRLRRLPFERGRTPGVVTSGAASPEAPDKIEHEDELGGANDQGDDRDEGIQRCGRGRNKSHLAHFVVPARHAHQADVVQWEEDRVGPEECDPEMELSERIAEKPTRDLRVPMVDPAEDGENRRDAPHHMKMRDDEKRGGKRHIEDEIAEEKAGEPAIHEGDDEGERVQHRHREVDVAAPERENPVEAFNGGGEGVVRGRGGKKISEG